ncbi:Sporulation protein YpeB [compost metagenome]
MSLQQARKYLNSDYKEKYQRLALIENDQSEKVLAYEFGGSINGSNYKIFINAENGNEESIEEIRSAKPNVTAK